MFCNFQHLFYDIHSHQKQEQAEVWRLTNLCFPQDSIDTIYYASKQPFSVGYHPWFLQQNYQEHFHILEQTAQNENVWAIGETGLDKVSKTDFELQLEAFRKHIAVSEQAKKPLIIHCVKAYNEVLGLHKNIVPTQNWLIHGFRANTSIALQLQKKGIYLSFGEALFRSPKLQETFAQIEPTHFFLETDDSNVPIEKIYEQAAKIRKINIGELQNQIKKNLCKFFG